MAVVVEAKNEESKLNRVRNLAVLALFTLTLFVSAALLFCVQPMVAKVVLPHLGGSPAVWNTCMVFFQAALLAGYAYAHATSSWLGVRRQAILHAVLLLLPAFLLPFAISSQAVRFPAGLNPAFWLLGLLGLTVGLPFFIVSATGPLLQKWFAQTGHPDAADPYFLYGASNLGSMLALLGYPFVIEPHLGLARQNELWAAGYGVLALLILACGMVAWRSPVVDAPHLDLPITKERQTRPKLGQWARWVALAFVPSSLMLGVTTFLTTDIAPIPLLWVVPLALYLLTFILAFAKRPPLPHQWMVRILPGVVVMLVLAMTVREVMRIWIPVHLLAFFVAAMVGHGELARSRPECRHLTSFYLAISLGGVLGGIFNALVAPLLFDRLVEYPLAIVLLCLILPANGMPRTTRGRVLDLVLPLILGVVATGLLWGSRARSDGDYSFLIYLLVISTGVFLCYTFKDHPVRFALGVGAVLLASAVSADAGRILHRERSFFGVLRVTQDNEAGFRRLLHGSTIHGQQSLDPMLRREPLTYYHRTGPIGQVFAELPRRTVAVVGLGAGSLACYAEPDQRWTFFEIDPAVVRIARDPRYFTYLEDCRAGATEVILGDARLRLRELSDGAYGLIVLDAFSSDAIPMHLLTLEALRIYRGKLAEGGVIALHISNRYVDLAPVLGALAREDDLVCRIRRDVDVKSDQLWKQGKTGSIWAVMAASEADLGNLVKDPRWTAPGTVADDPAWTDDFSDLVGHFSLRPR